KRGKILPNQSIDLYNATIVAVLPESCSEMFRFTIESLFITHADTKLNTIGHMLNENSVGNHHHPLFNPRLDRGSKATSTSTAAAAASTASSTGSSNKGQQIISSPSSTPKCYHRPWNELRHLKSIWTDTNLNGVQSQQHRTAIQAVHLANRMQHLHMIPDPINVCTRPLLPM
ncbi:unnamed protein product, partial [Rotaria magnacalcarata]